MRFSNSTGPNDCLLLGDVFKADGADFVFVAEECNHYLVVNLKTKETKAVDAEWLSASRNFAMIGELGRTIYDTLHKNGCPASDFDSHESDLYVKATPLNRYWVNVFNTLAETFPALTESANAFPKLVPETVTSFVPSYGYDGTKWLEIPFGYTPYWDAIRLGFCREIASNFRRGATFHWRNDTVKIIDVPSISESKHVLVKKENKEEEYVALTQRIVLDVLNREAFPLLRRGKEDTKGKAVVREVYGLCVCGKCSTKLLCNDTGDMPERCPKCQSVLDWSAFDTPNA